MANEATLEMIVRAQDQATRTLKQTESLLRSLGGAVTGGVTAPFRAASSIMGGFVDTMGRIGLAAMGIKSTIGAVQALTGGLIAGNAEFERYTVQFEVLLGSAEAAKKKLQDLAQFGATTPFELPEVVRASKTLQVFGGEALNTMKNLRLVGDIAAGVGRPFEDVAFWVGRLYSNLKGGKPIGEAAMALQEMGAMSGELRAKLEKLFKDMQDGKATAEDVFKAFAEGMREQFGGMMEKQSQTFEGMMSNLVDWWENTKRIIAEPIFDAVKKNLSTLLDFLGSDTVQQATQRFAEYLAAGIMVAEKYIRELIPRVKELVERIRSMPAQTKMMYAGLAAIAIIIPPVVSGIASMIGAIVGTVQAVKKLSMALSVLKSRIMATWVSTVAPVVAGIGTMTLVIGGIIAATGVLLVAWHKNWFGIRDITHRAVGNISNIVSEAITWMKGAFRKAGEWIGKIWSAVMGFLSEITGKGMLIVSDVISSVLQFISKVIGEAAKTIGKIWHAVLEFLSNITGGRFTAIANFIGKVVSWIGDTFSRGWNAVARFTGDILGKIAGMVGDAMAGIADSIAATFEKIPGVGSHIASGLRAAASAIRGVAQGAVGAIQSTLSNLGSVGEKIGEFMAKIPESTKNLLKSFLPQIENLVSGATGSLMSGLQDTISNLLGKAGLTKVMDDFGKALEEVRGKTSEMRTSIEQAIPPTTNMADALNTVKKAAKGAAKTAKTAAEAFDEVKRKAIKSIAFIQFQVQQGLMGQVDAIRAKIQVLQRVMSEAFELGFIDEAKRAAKQIVGLREKLKELGQPIEKVKMVDPIKAATDTLVNLSKASEEAMERFKDIAAFNINRTAFTQGWKQLSVLMKQLVVDFANLFSGLDETMAASLAKVAATTKVVMETVGNAVKAITAVASMDVEKTAVGGRGLEKARWVARRMAKILQELADVIRVEWVQAAAKLAAANAGNIKKALEPVRTMVEAIKSVASIDIEATAVGLRSGEKAKWVARRMAEILRQLNAVITVEWVQEAARGVAKHAEAVQKAIAPVKTIVDAIKAVASIDVEGTAVGVRSGEKAYWVARRMAEILRQLNAVIEVDWVQEAAKSVATQADVVKKALEPVKMVVEVIKAIASIDVEGTAIGLRSGGKAYWVARRMAEILRQLRDVIQVEWVQEAAKSVAEHAKAVQAALAPVKTVVDAITAVASLDVEGTAVGLKAGDKAYWVARRMAKILQELNEVMKVKWVQDAVQAAAEFSDNVKKAMSMVKPAVDAIRAVAEYEAVQGIGIQAAQFANDLANAVGEIGSVLSQVGEDVKKNIESAANMSAALNSVVGLIKPGVEAVSSIAMYTSQLGLSNKVEQFAGDLVTVAQTLVNKLNEAFGNMSEALTSASGIATQVKTIVGLVKPAVDALAALGEYTAMKDLQAKLASFKNDLVAVVDKMREIASKYADGLETTVAFSKATTTIAAGIKTSIEALTAISNYAPAKNIRQRMEKFRDDMVDLFGYVKEIRQKAGDDALPAAKAFKEIADAIYTSIKDAIESLRAVVWGTKGLEGAPAIFRQFVDAFRQLIENIRRVGYDLGREWMIGLENGLRSRLHNLEALLEYIRGLFPSSPAKYGPFRTLPDWGALLNGFDEALALATAGARELAAVPSPAFVGARGVSRGGVGATSSPIIVTINYSPGISLADRREVEERIAPLIEEALRRARRKRL